MMILYYRKITCKRQIIGVYERSTVCGSLQTVLLENFIRIKNLKTGDTFVSFATPARHQARGHFAHRLHICYALFSVVISAGFSRSARLPAVSLLRGVRGRSGSGNNCPNMDCCCFRFCPSYSLYASDHGIISAIKPVSPRARRNGICSNRYWR